MPVQNENYPKALMKTRSLHSAMVSSVFHLQTKTQQNNQTTSIEYTSHHYQKLFPSISDYKAFSACLFHLSNKTCQQQTLSIFTAWCFIQGRYQH